MTECGVGIFLSFFHICVKLIVFYKNCQGETKKLNLIELRAINQSATRLQPYAINDELLLSPLNSKFTAAYYRLCNSLPPPTLFV
jgi:hypothetical protein